MGFLELYGIFFYMLFSLLFCVVGSFWDVIYVEEFWWVRCLVDLMVWKFFVRNYIIFDLKLWCGMEEIVSKEGNFDFLYILYYDWRVFFWVLKVNGEILFWWFEEVDDKIFMIEIVFDLNSFFNKSFYCFGILFS